MACKKILVTGTRGVPQVQGGIETHCEELYPRLVALGYNVTLVRRKAYTSADTDREAGVQGGMWRGVRLVDLWSPKSEAFETLVHTLLAVLLARRIGVQVVHIHAIGPSLWSPLVRLLGMKVVVTHHGPDYDRDKWGRMARWVLRLGQRVGCRYADAMIVISGVIRDIVQLGCGRKERVCLICNGVPTPVQHEDPAYFTSLGICEGRYILAMCRFVPEKHLHDLVEAYACLRAEGRIADDIRLVLAGKADREDGYSADLKRQARECGVVLPGYVWGAHKQALLTHALCFALPSSHEGQPIALLEAMSYGLPVVASDIPANREVELPAECYHRVGDVAGLAERLAQVCGRPIERKVYDMARYDWDHIARQVAEVYEEVAGI